MLLNLRTLTAVELRRNKLIAVFFDGCAWFGVNDRCTAS